MLTPEKLARINALAKKAKTDGLSKEETLEQKKLREEYLKNVRASFENRLHSIKVVDPNGNDVTPKKLKESKKSKQNPKQ
ncbi:hypothetical protein A374_04884 [Fictibacillus macauensis ZFHKF-1]|uniref:UPF0291 protein A374_04884 n=1 Tax=Fictibacillus macauensis ZFHKF-1 TaxID=1196324 RepID=I8J4Z7_9BACL|nr:DUF896 domain-containing protein [Fictibacillus macauensis]EIT86881.1 hypothetical protein A374_04884 [Fictibacillus macauensis ZFHKF-1]